MQQEPSSKARPSSGGGPGRTSPVNSEARLVLIVDDEPGVIKFMTIDLKLRGFSVVSAGCGEDGLALARSSGPNIVLLDIIMPRMDGFEVLRRLRDFSPVPVIAFSANVENRTKALESGAGAFFTKPFRMADVVETMNGLLG